MQPERIQEQADLVYVAEPIFDVVVKMWEKEQFLIGISDRQGCLLHQSGHPWALERAMEINGVPGSGMAEEHIGTAVVNVVLARSRPDYVLWSEHYCRTLHPWATLSAPVRHPLTGEMIGVVAVGGVRTWFSFYSGRD